MLQFVLICDLLPHLQDIIDPQGAFRIRVIEVGLVETPKVEISGPYHNVRLPESHLLENIVNSLSPLFSFLLLPAAWQVAVYEGNFMAPNSNIDSQRNFEGNAVCPKVYRILLPNLDGWPIRDVFISENEHSCT